ncbi:MAG: leucyl aminopeptidase [Candidatus Andersenbacteria bacterium CG10_big_fil_rev_8_21_14_0_10_54_11]|uniref:Probable cytosol aminopeptidase n=1 Tax=Candidatus Andersenbacteria bacterium CG10_big_fil_rev_8_21_14_0_10_54_11 TaxID=1974485 RepID=A0A2M6WZ34_9BACT|nr:MAG: leucyl aminopeptidase [Candidatus Andersenbacteria bacterium CG10_big_fil_rev_8_21_14_0_10_54_11]
MAYTPASVVLRSDQPAGMAADAVVWPVFFGEVGQAVMPPGLRQAAVRLCRAHGFTGKQGEAVIFATHTAAFHGLPKPLPMPFVAITGLGPREDSTDAHGEALRRGLGRVVQELRKHGARQLAIALHHLSDQSALVGPACEGVFLAEYRFVDYSEQLRVQQERTRLKKLLLLLPDAQHTAARRAVSRSRAVAGGVALARDLVNRPAGALEPRDLAAAAREIAAAPSITVRILDRAQAKKAGFTAFLAVARGSSSEPYVIHLTYRPLRPKRPVPKVFLVGKGITFDSGGLSLKPAQYMEDMKIDMAGAAAVLGLFASLEALAPAAEVHGVIAACENMPSGAAYRPGDVVYAKNGTTIEVLNTDAEGRITLADALAYAAEHRPEAIVDLATLTGSCMATLGETVAGLWSNNDRLQAQLLAAAGQAGEQACVLPMPYEYRSQLESTVADLRNIGTTRFGDAIHAAMFLREFVGKVPWAHLDIAGPAYANSSVLPYYMKGATGYGVRLLANYLTVAGTAR